MPAAEPSTRLRARRWQSGLLTLAAVAAAGALWVTLSADFLRYPGWSAVQRADLILGPVLVGLYWWRRRPGSLFGPLLVAFGFVAVGIILEGAGQPLLFTLGVLWEGPFFVATLVVILAFPSGRLRGRVEPAIAAVAALVVPALLLGFVLVSPQISPRGSIAGCRGACPDNRFFVGSHPELQSALGRALDYSTIALALATGALVAARFVRGSAPQRRALAIGDAVGVVFSVAFSAYHLARLAHAESLREPLQWTVAGARSLVAWGFLVALLYAEVYAARLLRTTVGEWFAHSATADIERSLRAALGDPALRMGFRIPSGRLVGTDGRELEIPAPSSGRHLTEIARDGVPTAAIVHDARLEDDPELLLAASATALLMFENAQLEAQLGTALNELRTSRARLLEASDLERQRLERDLHGGVQQQLVALSIKVALARDLADSNPQLARRLGQLHVEIDGALDGLRDLTEHLAPPLLDAEGLVPALRAAATRSPRRVRVEAALERRYAQDVEAAVYHCCLEALENAADHGGPDVRVVIAVAAVDGELHFSVRDDGRGFDPSTTAEGPGFANMRDRLGAVGGAFTIESADGRGTIVSGTIPA